MNTCKTCTYWKPVRAVLPKDHQIFAVGGHCGSKKITEPIYFEGYAPDSLVYSYDEGGSFWTGPDFGCVHHTPKEAPTDLP